MNGTYSMEQLYDHIVAKSSDGIRYSEAIQLMLCLYCTLDILPKEFRKLNLSKVELAQLFSKLAVNGKILPEEGATNPPCAELFQTDYWEDLTRKLLQGQIALDPSFLERASQYV